MSASERATDLAPEQPGEDAAMLARARAVAAAVPDPELPFVTVEDLGILRAVNLRDGKIFADVSPTYSGCPAVAVIEQSIEQALRDAGFDATVRRVMSPAWTTDWITDNGRRKLQQNGIAPPAPGNHAKPALFASTVVECPLCQSKSTEKISEFGSTPCKAQYRCNTCREPFDYFKCL